MMDVKRGVAFVAAMLLTGAALAGCSTVGDDAMASSQSSQVTPVQDSSVASNSLPPIGGSDGSVQVASADPVESNQPGMPVMPGGNNTSDPGLSTNVAGTQSSGEPGATNTGSFVSLSDVGKVPSQPGRDLGGSLTIEKLLGGWTVTSGAQQCRLNLTYTASNTPGRYRASSPGCAITTLAGVSSWQLTGTQVQLFNDGGALVGALLLSGNRFVGTLSGGQAVSMVG